MHTSNVAVPQVPWDIELSRVGFLSRACVTPVKILLEPDEDCLLSVRDLAAGTNTIVRFEYVR